MDRYDGKLQKKKKENDSSVVQTMDMDGDMLQLLARHADTPLWAFATKLQGLLFSHATMIGDMRGEEMAPMLGEKAASSE